MTNTEPGFLSNPVLRKALIIGLGGLSLIFLAGVLAGFTAAVMERDSIDAADIGIIAGVVAVITAIAYGCWKLWPTGSDEPVAASTLKARNLLYVALAVGAALGIFMVADGGAGSETIFSNGPISSTFAAIAIATWIIAVPILTWLWWRAVDEHEATAYRDGALVAAHAYLFIAPTWWIAARAGWIPPQDPMIVLSIICGIWTAIWLYRKYT